MKDREEGGTVSVPQDRNRRPRAGIRGADRRAGAARERRRRRSDGWRGSLRTSEVGWSDRRAPIREAHGHITYILGAAAGAGEGMDGGAMGRHAGGFVRVWCNQSEDVIPFDVLDHRLWPPDKRAARDLD